MGLQRDLDLKSCPLTGSGDDSVGASDRIESLSYPDEPEAGVAFPAYGGWDVEADGLHGAALAMLPSKTCVQA